MFHRAFILNVILFCASVTDGLFSSSFPEYLALQKLQDAATFAKDAVVSFANQYREDRKNQLSVIDGVLSGFTVGIRDALPSEIPIISLEDNYDMYMEFYLCTNHGSAGNLKTIRKIDRNRYFWHSDGSESLDITVYYNIKQFSISFSTFYFESKMKTPLFAQSLNAVTGKVALTYGNNRIAVKMSIPNLLNALKGFATMKRNLCLVFVKSFVWEELGNLRVSIQTDSYLNRNDWLSRTVMRVMSQHHSFMMKIMQRQLLTQLVNLLPMKPVCKHPDLELLAAEFSADSKPREYSAKFKEKCGRTWKSKKNFAKSLPPNNPNMSKKQSFNKTPSLTVSKSKAIVTN